MCVSLDLKIADLKIADLKNSEADLKIAKPKFAELRIAELKIVEPGIARKRSYRGECLFDNGIAGSVHPTALAVSSVRHI